MAGSGSQSALSEPIFVTGATGFIGRHLINRLLIDGYAVIAFDLPSCALPADWDHRVQVRYGDITNCEDVRAALHGARTAFHLAAMVGDWGNDELFWKVTVEGSRNVYEAAIANGTHVILASSIVVYGDHLGKQVCTEDTPFGKSFGPYSRCKQAQEKLAWEYAQARGLQLSVVRPANIYGPGSRIWVDSVIEVLRSGMPCLIDGGKFNAGLVYVDNVVDILILVGALPHALGRSYNACDEAEITWEHYFSDIARLVDAPMPKSMPASIARIGTTLFETTWKLCGVQTRPPLTWELLNLVSARHQISMQRVRDELGYTPRVSYSAGIRAVEAYLHRLHRVRS